MTFRNLFLLLLLFNFKPIINGINKINRYAFEKAMVQQQNNSKKMVVYIYISAETNQHSLFYNNEKTNIVEDNILIKSF